MSSPRPPYGRRPLAAGGPGGPPLRLGHLVPERRPVVIERPNPDWLALDEDDPRRAEIPEMLDVILSGYVFGDRCPGVVKAELASIEGAYHQALASTEADDGAGAAIFIAAWHTFLRESISALVPGLTAGEADVLASVPPGQDGPGTALLRYLGVWREQLEGDQTSDPEARGEADPSITEPSSPSLPPSTD